MAESEKPRRRVGIADRKVFARPESFCAYLHEINSKHSIVWRVSTQSGNKKDSLESFRTVSGQSEKCSDSLESFRRVWKVSTLSGKFLDNLESFETLWKVSGGCGKFPDSLESFRTVWKVSCRSNPWPSECLPRIKCTPQQCRKQS